MGDRKSDDEWGDDGDDDDGWGDDDGEDGWGDDDGDGDWGDDDADGPDAPMPMADPFLEDVVKPKSIKILTMESVWKRMETLITTIVETLCLDEEETIVLLRHFKWNSDKLISVYADKGDELRLDLGLDVRKPMVAPKSGEVECPQCMDDVDVSQIVSLKCGHFSCFDCWTEYLTHKCTLGLECVGTRCNYYKCNLLVPRSVFKRFCSAESFSNYQKWIIRSYIENTRELAYCPAPGCQKVAESSMGGVMEEVRCDCGYNFCFKCGKESHRPANCEDARKWIDKCESESENATWIVANTKTCPKCKRRIEKNQGCNHMTCSQCKHEFCWLCKGDWKDHGSSTGGYYKCNKYEADKASGKMSTEESAQKDAKMELERYMFYYTRYDNHQKAFDFAKKTLVQHEANIMELQKRTGDDYNKLQYIFVAVNEVMECRRLLKWTYPKAYFITDPMEKTLFEDQQQNLEKYVEDLHGLTEKPLEQVCEIKFRTHIVHQTRMLVKFRENIINGMEDGVLS